MNVKALVVVSVWLACSTPPIRASERYAFRVAEGTQALAGQPQPPNMGDELAGKPLMVLIAVDGTQWRWILNGCLAMSPCEFRIDDRGGQRVRPEDDVAAPTHAWDVGLTRIDATRFRLRCLRASCLVRHRAAEATRMSTDKLLRGRSIELPVDSVIDLQLTDDAKR